MRETVEREGNICPRSGCECPCFGCSEFTKELMNCNFNENICKGKVYCSGSDLSLDS